MTCTSAQLAFVATQRRSHHNPARSFAPTLTGQYCEKPTEHRKHRVATPAGGGGVGIGGTERHGGQATR